MPPKIREKIFFGQLLCKIRDFGGKNVKCGHFVNFSDIFQAKMSCPLKLTELLCLLLFMHTFPRFTDGGRCNVVNDFMFIVDVIIATVIVSLPGNTTHRRFPHQAVRRCKKTGHV